MIEPQVRDEITASVDSLTEELVHLVSETVKIPSINPRLPGQNYDEIVGGEGKVAAYLKPIMDNIGLETELVEKEKGRANLVGVCKGSGGGKSLIFNGHMDVVPPDPIEDWTEAEPWSGEVKDGKIYGRGAADMKGGNAAAIIALKGLLKAGYRPKGDVILENVAGEEIMDTEIGTGAVIEAGYKADAAIVVEPTGYPTKLAIATASAHAFLASVTIHGKATHCQLRAECIRAGNPGSKIGVSSLDKAFLIYEGLRRLEDEWGVTKSHPLWSSLPGKFVVFPTDITGNPGGATLIPGETTFTYIVMTPPDEDADETKKEVTEAIHRIAQTDSWLREHPPKVDWLLYWPAYETPLDAPICKSLHSAYEMIMDAAPVYSGFWAQADASFLSLAGIPSVCFGPGETMTAHSANEFVRIDELVNTAKIYATTIAEWCGV